MLKVLNRETLTPNVISGLNAGLNTILLSLLLRATLAQLGDSATVL